MQWILSGAVLPPDWRRGAGDGLRGPLQALAARLSRLVPAWTDEGEPDSLSPPHERAHARLLGWPPDAHPDGGWPWAAWSRHQAGLLPTDAQRRAGWGRLTPAHGRVGSDQITLLSPQALRLTEAESRQLFEALTPLFESEGVSLHWRDALAWDLCHDSLRDLPCASLDRVSGHSAQRWQGGPGLRGGRLIRRLQNEAQMVLHQHPLNLQRDAHGALPVNTLWLSGCGALTAAAAAQAPGSDPVHRDDRLRQGADEAAAAADLGAWIQAWASLADSDEARRFDEALQSWQARPSAGPPPTLVLCGDRSARAWTAPRPEAAGGGGAWLRRWWGRGRPGALTPDALQDLLADL